METLKDGSGRVIGSLQHSGNQTKLYKVGGKFLGWYDRGTDRTYDVSGRVVAQGNQVLRLLK